MTVTGTKGSPIKDKARRRRDARSARAVITRAAARQFARKGYHGTTIEEIAEAAGYSPAAIYKYFRNKEDLYGVLWASMADKLRVVFQESTDSEVRFPQRLTELASKLGQLLIDSPDLLIAFMGHGPHMVRQPENNLERMAAEQFQRVVQQVAAFAARGIAEGELRDEPPEDFALLLLGLMRAFAIRWVTSCGNFDLPANRARMVELFLNGAARSPS